MKKVYDIMFFREKYCAGSHISPETRIPIHISTKTICRFRFHEEMIIQTYRPLQQNSRAEIPLC
jgi:hypothetical protein